MTVSRNSLRIGQVWARTKKRAAGYDYVIIIVGFISNSSAGTYRDELISAYVTYTSGSFLRHRVPCLFEAFMFVSEMDGRWTLVSDA